MRFVSLLLIAWSLGASAAQIDGRVIGVHDGRGVAQAAVTLTCREGTAGPHAVTVFTGPDGRFRFPTDAPSLESAAKLEARKLGFRQVELAEATDAADKRQTLYVEPVADIAGQVPASAWLAQMPSGDERNITIASCSSCHQMASPRVREYAMQIEAASNGADGDARALEQWRKVVRHESWRTIVKYMRAKHYSVFPLESAMNLDAVDWAVARLPCSDCRPGSVPLRHRFTKQRHSLHCRQRRAGRHCHADRRFIAGGPGNFDGTHFS
jgi:hypothetical protein